MKIKIRRHPGTPPDTRTYTHEVGARVAGVGTDFAFEEFDVDAAATVEISDAFNGPILRNDGVCLSVFARDDGFEFFCWRQPDDQSADRDAPLPFGAMAGSVSPFAVSGWREDGYRSTVLSEGQLDVGIRPQANLGLATTGELVEELVARWQTSRLGVLDPDYSTVPRPDIVEQRQTAEPADFRTEEQRERAAATIARGPLPPPLSGEWRRSRG